jgi:hypothetical protein
MHLMTLFLAGCAELPGGASRIDDAVPEVVRSAETGTLYTLDDDAEAVVQYDPTSGWSRSTPLGTLPGRLARVDDTVWVTLPAARGIAVLVDGPDGLTRTDTLATGAEPLGIAANADGTRLYVALATSGMVQELTPDGEVLRSWEVEGQPSWIALRPDGDALYVGSAMGGVLTWIDLLGGTAQTVELPVAYRPDSDASDGNIDVTFPLTHRITGDPSVSADGSLLAVPMLLVDNTRRISTGNDDPDTASDFPSENDGYGSEAGNDVSRINPVVALVQLDPGGVPDGVNASLVLVTAVNELEVRVRSYLSSAHVSPDGSLVFATMEASSAVVALSTAASNKRGSLWIEDTIVIPTPAGPRATTFLGDDRVYVDSFLDRSITSVSLREVRNGLDAGPFSLHPDQVTPELTLEPSPLPMNVLAGRELFYSATDTRMAGEGSGISCSTCHLGGRNDGLSWNLEGGARQTPSLAGGIADTAPFTWTSDVSSVSQEATLTSEGRMGGRGLNFNAFSIAAFVETIRAPDVPGLGATDAAVARGEAIFNRADVGCGSCHSGELYTDNQSRSLFGAEGVNTPSLRRVAATAPYLHDGRAPTLRALLEISVGGAMGDTSMLSTAELDDLEAYLRSI